MRSKSGELIFMSLIAVVQSDTVVDAVVRPGAILTPYATQIRKRTLCEVRPIAGKNGNRRRAISSFRSLPDTPPPT